MTINHHGAVLDFVHAEDARLWRVKDRRGHERTVDAAVRDREGPALHFRHGQFAVTGAFALFCDGFFDLGEGHLVGVTDHWHHKARGCARSDAHVHKLFVHDVGAVDLSVYFRDFFQGVTARFGEERHKAQTRAVFLLKQVLVFLAQRHRRRHVDLIVCRQHGGRVLAVFQALGDGLAQASHFDPFFAGCIISGYGCARGGGGRSRSWGRSGTGNSCHHVLFHHAAITARALNRRRVNALFRHDFLGRWCVLYVLGT